MNTPPGPKGRTLAVSGANAQSPIQLNVGFGVGYAQGVRNVLVVACASALGVVWGCTSFDTVLDDFYGECH